MRGRNSSPPQPPPPPPPNNHRHRRRRRRHRHHLAKIELGHLFTRSSLTLLEFSIMASSGFYCLWSVVFLLSSAIYYWAFCIYVANSFFFIPVFCPELGLHLFPLQSRRLFSICPSLSCCISHIFHLCCWYSSCVSCFNGIISPLYNKAGRSGVLHCFILLFFQAFYGLLFSNSYSVYQGPILFHQI